MIWAIVLILIIVAGLIGSAYFVGDYHGKDKEIVTWEDAVRKAHRDADKQIDSVKRAKDQAVKQADVTYFVDPSKAPTQSDVDDLIAKIDAISQRSQ